MSREKQIEELINELVRTNGYGTLNAVAESLYNAGYRKQEWISVNERLPEERERVLVVCEDGVVRLNMVKFGYFPEITNIDLITVKTTHWMPLPDPPKGE